MIICGSIAIDRIMHFKGSYQELLQPDKLSVLSLSVLVDSVTIAPGGIGANIAHNYARLGQSPILLGAVGEDARDYLTRLADIGVDVSQVHVSDNPTASFTALTDDENNQVGGFYPGAMADAETLSLDNWAGQDVLLCHSAHDPAAMRRLTVECKTKNVRMLYDPGQQVSSLSPEDLMAGIEAAEVVAVNEYEHSMLLQKTGLSPDQLASQVDVLILTKGENGSVITGRSVSETLEIGCVPAARAVDPTGAGDGYRAGFLYGYLRQWDLAVCAQLGAVVASFVLETAGTQVELSLPAIAQRYKQTFNEEIEF